MKDISANSSHDHQQIALLLDAYSTHELESAEQSEVEQHLPHCQECQHLLNEITMFHSLLKQLAQQTPEIGASAKSDLQDEQSLIRNTLALSQPHTPIAFRRHRTLLTRLSGIVAVLIAALLVGSLIITLRLAHESNAGLNPGKPTLMNTPPIKPGINPQNIIWNSIKMVNASTGWGAIQVRSNARGPLNAQSDILRTTDGGSHWQNITPMHASIHSQAFLTATLAWAFGTQNNDGHAYIFRTGDGGQTWQSERINLLSPNDYPQISAINAQECWLLSNGSIFHTPDGGKTWEKLLAPEKSSDLSLILFVNSSTGWVAGASLYVTHDGGQTWQQQALPLLPSIMAAQPIFTIPVFITPDDGILAASFLTERAGIWRTNFYVTHDGGTTWNAVTPLPIGIDYLYNVAFININHWLVFEDPGFMNNTTRYQVPLYETTDGGRHWTTEHSFSSSHAIYNFSFVSDTVGWAIGNDMPRSYPAGAFRSMLYKTVDGGHTWMQADYVVS